MKGENNMLKAAIEKIVELAKPAVIQVEGKTFSNIDFSEVKPERPTPARIEFNTLEGIVKMVLKEALTKFPGTLFVRITEYNTVDVFTAYDSEMKRDWIYRATSDVPGFKEGFRDREDMIIRLRSLFLQTPDVQYLLDLLSKMTDQENVTMEDNGVTQVVEAKKGIALKQQIQIKPRVSLTPFRTFLEVEQPESSFLLRISGDGRIGLFEADGGVWKLDAKRRIKKHLMEELQVPVESEKVVITM